MFAEKLYELRVKQKVSQEELADQLGISRQAIQKWETNAGFPTVDNLLKISELFGVSLDYLCKNDRDPGENAGRLGAELLPSFESMHGWESYSKSLEIEYRQCYDEGKDIEKYRDLFFAVAKMPDNVHKERISDELFLLTRSLPVRKEYKYFEPSDYSLIRARAAGYCAPLTKGSDSMISDKVLGGWYGRICGCFLGKPVEGIRLNELKKVLKASNNDPLTRYIDREDLPEVLDEEISFHIRSRAYPKHFGKMPVDDDTNYMLLGYEILRRYGRDFTPENVAEAWLNLQTKNAYCTAERVAYKNFVNGYRPPVSGEYKNAYREWIGAQIRGDFYGYINPFHPEKAAEMAYRDACISHVKNGIYGEMWVSAMIAAAFGTTDIRGILQSGLGQIPQSSRLWEAVQNIIYRFEGGVNAEACFRDIHSRWDEKKGYDWCHTVSNAEIVAASLLYGKGDYGKSVCLAVQQGFDTDCNGATVGSVLGVMLGYSALPQQWTARICDTLESSLFGYTSVSIKEMAAKTLEFTCDDES